MIYIMELFLEASCLLILGVRSWCWCWCFRERDKGGVRKGERESTTLVLVCSVRENREQEKLECST